MMREENWKQLKALKKPETRNGSKELEMLKKLSLCETTK